MNSCSLSAVPNTRPHSKNTSKQGLKMKSKNPSVLSISVIFYYRQVTDSWLKYKNSSFKWPKIHFCLFGVSNGPKSHFYHFEVSNGQNCDFLLFWRFEGEHFYPSFCRLMSSIKKNSVFEFLYVSKNPQNFKPFYYKISLFLMKKLE